jgi:hypothetical protein
VVEGKGTDKRGVHQTEHRAVASDADREYQHRNGGERRGVAQRARSVADVLPDPHARLDGGGGAGLVRERLVESDAFRLERVEHPPRVQQRALDHGMPLKRREGVVEALGRAVRRVPLRRHA